MEGSIVSEQLTSCVQFVDTVPREKVSQWKEEGKAFARLSL